MEFLNTWNNGDILCSMRSYMIVVITHKIFCITSINTAVAINSRNSAFLWRT